MNKLVSGNLDIIIDNAINENENIISEVYAPETLLLAVPKSLKSNESVLDFAMTAQDIKENKHLDENMSVKLSTFKDERFILLNPENDTGKRAEKLFKKYGISPSVIFHLDQQVTAFNMACLGLGITFVSDTLIKYDDSERDMYYYRLFDIGTNRNIYFYRKKNHYQSVASRKFIEHNTHK